MEKFIPVLTLFAIYLHCFLSEAKVPLKHQVVAAGDINLGPVDYNCPSYGALPHPEYCNLYYTCYQNTQVYLWQCRGDLLFDTVYSGCNFPDMTYCGNRTRPGPTTTTPTTTQSTPSFKCPGQDGNFAASKDCSPDYFTCVNGIAYPQTCPGNGVFDPITSNCKAPEMASCSVPSTSASTSVNPLTTSPKPPTSAPFSCPSSATATYPNPTNCSQYYSCVGGNAYVFTCPSGLVYNPVTMLCDWSYNVPGCQRKAKELTSNFTCPESDGIFPYPNECSGKYYSCYRWEPFLRSCPDSLIFDPVTHICEKPEVASCHQNNLTTPDASQTTVVTPPSDFVCPVSDGVFPDPRECSRFYVCIAGRPVANKCPDGLHFDPVHGLCDYPEIANCYA